MTYIDTKAIMETRFSYHIDWNETRFYNASITYVLAVDGINGLKDAKGEGVDNFSLPLEELLQMCKKESAASLMAAVLYCCKRENNTSALLWQEKEKWALEKERLVVILLHGEDVTIWKGKNPLKRKKIG
jgi:hypothetical protein